MKDKGWHIELFEVLSEIRLRESLYAVVVRLHSSLHALQPPARSDAFRNLCAWAVVAVERECNVPVKIRPICQELGSEAVEHRDGLAGRILVRLQH